MSQLALRNYSIPPNKMFCFNKTIFNQITVFRTQEINQISRITMKSLVTSGKILM